MQEQHFDLFVDEGEAFLLSKGEPRWFTKTDPETFNVNVPGACALGQVQPEGWGYWEWLEHGQIDPYDYGFCPEADEEAPHLNAAWIRRITKRREENQ